MKSRPHSISRFKQFTPLAGAIVALFNPHAEVVIHDLKTQKIAAIFNNFSKRKVGDDALLEEDFTFNDRTQIIGPYPKINWDGRKLKSITSILRDSDGVAIGLMCVNLDVSHFENFAKNFSGFLEQKASGGDAMDMLFKNDWREKVNTYIDQYLRSHSKTLTVLSKQEQAHLVQSLYQDGGFEGATNVAAYVGDVLGISRATVYNYLKSDSQVFGPKS